MLIPDSEIENIFTPFYRLKETEHQLGSGIGLSRHAFVSPNFIKVPELHTDSGRNEPVYPDSAQKNRKTATC